MTICVRPMSPPLSNAKRAWVAPISPRRFVLTGSFCTLDFVRHGRLRRSLAIELRHQPDGNRTNQNGHGSGVEKFRRSPARGEQESRHEGPKDAADAPDAERPAEARAAQ